MNADSIKSHDLIVYLQKKKKSAPTPKNLCIYVCMYVLGEKKGMTYFFIHSLWVFGEGKRFSCSNMQIHLRTYEPYSNDIHWFQINIHTSDSFILQSYAVEWKIVYLEKTTPEDLCL